MYTERMIRRGDYTDAHRIRIQVFVEEQGFVQEIDGLDDEAWHLVIYDGAAPVATARAFLDDAGVCKSDGLRCCLRTAGSIWRAADASFRSRNAKAGRKAV